MKVIMDKLKKEKINRASGVLKEGIYRTAAGLKAEYAVTEEPVPYAKRLSLKYNPIREGEKWSKNGLWDCGWFHITGEVPVAPEGCELCLALDFDGEGCVFGEDGSPLRGITNVSSEFDRMLGFPGKRYVPFSDGTFATEHIDLWVETGNNDLFGGAHSGTVKECAVVACNVERRALYYDYMVLRDLADCTPDTDPLHYALIYSLEEVAMRASRDMSSVAIEDCRAILRPHLERRNIAEPLLRFYSVGHSHLDLAWLWPLRESRRKAGRTFATALANLKAYPDYVYGASQPQQFEWVKQDYPALYEKIKEAVKKGRFEVQGGMWVEADTNITGGESLVRQFLYGKRFWKEEFGKDVDTLWLPDVFGFSGALPQILRGCGCENFLTIKLSWNMVNKFPYHSFRWQGIDGSEVLVHMPPEGNYNSSATPQALKYAAGNYSQRGISRNAMMLYGIGDGGGGPGRDHLEYIKREKDVYGVPPVVNAPSTAFFAELKKEADKLPVYKGEIYLERHQGTYTSQSKNKHYNRLIENALAEYEFAQAVSGNNDRVFAERIWKEVLLYQFHDILPGSSIQRVYNESVPRYEKLLSETENATARLLNCCGEEKCILNATSYFQKSYVKENGDWYMVEASPYSLTRLGQKAVEFDVYAKGNVIGNSLVEAEFDKDGALNCVTDKMTGRHLLSARSGDFVVYNDTGDAWDFYYKYSDTIPEKFRLISSRCFSDGARAGIVREYVYGNSRLVQTASVLQDSPLVYFDVEVDWQETEKMLRTDFYPAISADEVTCDIQWGNVRRSMLENDSIQTAQYEVCAHKWVDMSESEFGVAILNDGKYGYRCKHGCISIDLLRSEMYPCADQDKGKHKFSYALYGHAGDLEHSDVPARAYLMNRPLKLVTGRPTESFVSTSDRHAVIETVKPAEDGEGVIIRFYNDTSHPITTKIFAEGKAVFTDMLEKGNTPVGDVIHLHAFEIVTLRICKK